MNRYGNRPKWPLHKLKVGESLVIPWLVDEHGVRRPSQKVLHVMVWRVSTRTGFRFTRAGDHPGLRVTRVA